MTASVDYAVIGFCRDLTDPDATSERLGLVGVLKTERLAAAFVGVRTGFAWRYEVTGDPVSRLILSELPEFLFGQVREALVAGNEDDLISWMCANLRDSLHVLEVDSIVSRAETPRDVLGVFMGLFADHVIEEAIIDLPEIHMIPLEQLMPVSADQFMPA